MARQPAAQSLTPMGVLARFALIPPLVMLAAATQVEGGVLPKAMLVALALGACGTLAMAGGMRVHAERGPANAALLVTQIAGLAAAMIAVQSSAVTATFAGTAAAFATGLMHFCLGIVVALEAMPAQTLRARRH